MLIKVKKTLTKRGKQGALLTKTIMKQDWNAYYQDKQGLHRYMLQGI